MHAQQLQYRHARTAAAIQARTTATMQARTEQLQYRHARSSYNAGTHGADLRGGGQTGEGDRLARGVGWREEG